MEYPRGFSTSSASRATPVRQSTRVPKTSKNSALMALVADVVTVHGLLRAAQRGQLPVHDQISCFEAVIATLDVSLPHAIGHVDVIQRADDALEFRRTQLRAFVGG